MFGLPIPKLVALLAPLLLLGFAAGAIRVVLLWPGISPRRRRVLQVTWVLLLLAGAPLWLVLAAVLGLW